MKCPICNHDKDNQIFNIKEMQMGLREEFEYVECSNCGCLFIKEIPEDIGKYYDSDYAPHKHEDNYLDKFSKKLMGMYISNNAFIKLIFDKRVSITTKFWNSLVDKKFVNLNSQILDVGCGDGNFLNILKKGGFKNLTGIDLFIDSENILDGITIYKSSLEDFKSNKKFDLIVSNHSFEHMDNQLINLQCFENLVKKDGTIVIRIPIKSDFFWKTYGVNWYQIDAPRHFFLHTIESFKILCSKTNLKIVDIICDSYDYCMINCEKYSRDISTRDEKWSTFELDKNTRDNIKKKTYELNVNTGADQAIFVLRFDK